MFPARLFKPEMATRNPGNLPDRTETRTEFQIYSERSPTSNVADLTEKRLIKFASEATDPQQKLMLEALIEAYRNGQVAVAWRRGRPVPMQVSRDK